MSALDLLAILGGVLADREKVTSDNRDNYMTLSVARLTGYIMDRHMTLTMTEAIVIMAVVEHLDPSCAGLAGHVRDTIRDNTELTLP